MATLTLIGVPMPGLEAVMHAAAARDLAEAVGFVAPRGCSARLLVEAGAALPTFTTPRARAESLPMKAHLAPLLWRNGVTARPLDGEFVHAVTPLVPLRSRQEDDATQTTVTVPHALAWLAPETMGQAEARQYRAYVKRALRLADAVITPTHATANVLFSRFGPDLPVQVLPMPAPTELARPCDTTDAEARRAALGVPERYVITTASTGEHGRLEWLLDALAGDPELPDLVVITTPAPATTGGRGATPATNPTPVPEALRGRVHLVEPRELADWGALLSGALLLAVPQRHLGTGYEVLGAIDAGVPVLCGECEVAAELALDAGAAAADAAEFARTLARLTGDEAELAHLRVLAEDRSRAFSWATTAWQLWELHAAL